MAVTAVCDTVPQDWHFGLLKRQWPGCVFDDPVAHSLLRTCDEHIKQELMPLFQLRSVEKVQGICKINEYKKRLYLRMSR